MTAEQAAFVSAVGALVGAIAAVVSAIAAVAAIRAQRRAQEPQVTVAHGAVVLAYGAPGMPGAHVGDEPWFGITVANVGVVPVTVTSAAIVFKKGMSPYLEARMGGTALPKRLEAGEEANLFFDELRRVAAVHTTPGEGPAKYAQVSLAGGRHVKGPPIDSDWLTKWANSGT